jgi:hypothetical protein
VYNLLPESFQSPMSNEMKNDWALEHDLNQIKTSANVKRKSKSLILSFIIVQGGFDLIKVVNKFEWHQGFEY